jgi:hypothetical protein
MCAKHHAEGHNIGWRIFQDRHGLDLREAALRLAALSPYLSTT